MSINQLLFNNKFPVIPFLNLVPNGNMELDSNWTDFAGMVSSRTTEQVHGGTYARKCVASGDWQWIKGDPFTTTSGNRYKFTGWIWTTSVNAAVIVFWGDGVNYTIFNAVGSVGTWGSIDISYVDPIGGSSAAILFYGYTDTFYLDDLSVIEMPNLVPNGMMELTTNWNDKNTPAVNTRSTEQVHSGTYSRKVVSDSVNDGTESDPFITNTGKTYTVSAWVYSSDPSNTNIYMWSGDGAHLPFISPTGGSANTWVYFTTSFVEGYGGGSAQIGVQAAVGGVTFYLDEVVVSENP